VSNSNFQPQVQRPVAPTITHFDRGWAGRKAVEASPDNLWISRHRRVNKSLRFGAAVFCTDSL
jgi:hypothetical protein